MIEKQDAAKNGHTERLKIVNKQFIAKMNEIVL